MLDLLSVIRQESDLVVRFAALLHQEQEALKEGNPAVLPTLTQNKATLIEEMNNLAIQRNRLLAVAGCGKDRDGMNDWLSRNPGEKTIQQAWTTLLQHAEEARQLNQLNGRLISMHLHATQEALGTLTQQARHTGIYGPSGQSTPLTGHRIIDSA